jgi:drug/metabolite transporter (DMT)-like permease
MISESTSGHRYAPGVPALRLDRTAATLFAACTLIIASNSVAVRFSDRELDPSWGASLRFALAAAVFLTLSLVLRLPPPRGRDLASAVIFGALNYAGAVGLAYYAFVHVHAGIGQVLFALVPLATLLLAALQRQSTSTRGEWSAACWRSRASRC